MRLASKLTVALVVGILVVMAGYAWVQVRQETVLFQSDIKNPRRGQAFRAAIKEIWLREGAVRAREVVEEVARHIADAEVRWFQMDELRADAARAGLSPVDVQAIADGDIREIVRTDEGGETRRYAYLPMGIDDTILEASLSLHQQTTFVRMSHRAILFATVLIALVCGLIAMGLGFRLVGRPLAQLRDQARRIGSGDLSARSTIRQDDEIGELAREMNTLCDRLIQANERVAEETDGRIAALEQLRHSDRLATVGQMASGIAHELGTPLSIVAARAALVASPDESRDEVVKNARIIIEQANRMTDIIRQLLDFSRRRGAQMQTADLRRVIDRTVELLAPAARRTRVRLESVTGPAPVFARVDQNQVQQALTNVLVNGIQAMPGGGRLAVCLSRASVRPPSDHGGAEDAYPCITVEDEGSGIASDHLARVFEPFFTTKGVGEGTGLGLSVSHGIVAEHGGWIQVESEVGKGTRFRIFLPPATAEGLREVAS